jgi:hypothetical protein
MLPPHIHSTRSQQLLPILQSLDFKFQGLPQALGARVLASDRLQLFISKRQNKQWRQNAEWAAVTGEHVVIRSLHAYSINEAFAGHFVVCLEDGVDIEDSVLYITRGNCSRNAFQLDKSAFGVTMSVILLLCCPLSIRNI